MRIGPYGAAPLIALAVALAAASTSPGAEPEIVVIVSQQSTVTALTRDQVADIFLGKASRLPGGTKAVPLDQPEGSALRESFYREYAGKSRAQLKAHWARIIFTGRGQPPAEVPDSQAARKQVAESPGTLAYVERSQVDASVRVVSD
jgi:ABC-type phosphate transport system substrate-binding protein